MGEGRGPSGVGVVSIDLAMLSIRNYIAGKCVEPAGGAWLDVEEPATGKVYAQVADSTVEDVEAAVQAAKAAFPAWSATPSGERSRLLHALADQIDANLGALAEAESRDTGKPISLARTVDIPRSAANLRYFAGAVLHGQGEYHEFDGAHTPTSQGGSGVKAMNFTMRKPRGVAGLISPWNLPLYLLTWKIAPALATGNTAVCKPSEVTPRTASMLGELATASGIPAGVLNIVNGRGAIAGGAIVQHADVPQVSFTGSTGVGRWIGREAGERLKRVSLELGGKNPMIVFDDVDVDEAATLAARASFSNQGQICLCASRILVHERIADRFTAALVERARALKPGDPSDPATQFGASVSREHVAKVDGYVQLARSLGGRVLCGGACPAKEQLPERCRDGHYYQPTVIEGLDAWCRVEQEEIFGPVVSVTRFSSEEQAIGLANATAYGLAATVLTNDLGRANRTASAVNAGIVWVNCWLVRDLRTPFGGMGQSGVGREGGTEAIKFFTEPRNVCIKM